MPTHDEVDDVLIPTLQLGVYQHYRGNRYKVEGVALHSETLEPMVVYRPLYETKAPLWVRPYSMFIEMVVQDGVEVPRFRKVD